MATLPTHTRTHHPTGRLLRALVIVCCLPALLLSGCGPGPAAAPTSNSVATPTSEPAASSPTPAPTAAPAATPTPTAAAEAPAFRVIGYATAATVVGALQFDKLTHINYAFLIPNADGTFVPMPNQWKLDDLVAQAHAHDVRVLISVGGWGWDAEFEAMAADSARRAVFVDGLTAFVAEHNLDGADIDWEYPDPGDSALNFLLLMQELRVALPAGKLLTAAVVALGATGEGVAPEAFDLMDFVNIMAYDGGGPRHASYEYAEAAIDFWQARGLPLEKTVLGVPFYSRPNGVAYNKLVGHSGMT